MSNLSPIGMAAWGTVTGLFIGATAAALWYGFVDGNLAMIMSASMTALGWGGILVVRFGKRT